VSPLLHQSILALFEARNTEERTDLLVRLVMLELHQAEDSTTFVPLPHEPRCRRAAMIVLDDPTGAHDIDSLAREVGTSARTLSRLFSTETQLSFKSWCQRAGFFGSVPPGHGADADGVCGEIDCRTHGVIARLDRAIQYSEAARLEPRSRNVLDAPVKPGHDSVGVA